MTKTRRRPSYKQIRQAARAIHEANFIAHGDSYATTEEMEMHRTDPLACNELVDEALAALFGFDDRFAMSAYTRTKLTY